MKISVIIPVYNTKHEYLEYCLKSLVTQDFDDFEMIVVNDGSTNGCEKVIKAFASEHGNIVHIDQENSGTSVARNSGLEAAKGEYVLFVDGDDFVSEGCLRRISDAMEKNPCDILFFGYATNYTNREVQRVLPEKDPALFTRDALELAVLQGDPRLGAVEVGAPWGKIIKRSVIEDNKVRYTPGLIKGQDTVFILSLLDHCESFDYLSFLGYHYRISGSSISRRYNPDIVGIMEKTLNAYMDFVTRRNKPAIFKAAVQKKYINVLLGEYLELLYLHPEAEEPLKEREKSYRELIMREPYRSAIWESRERKAALLKKGRVLPVFMIKKAELILRNIVIHKYG